MSLVAAAIERVADVDERRIHAHAEDHTVTITGTVDLLYQRREVERAVSDIPGVAEIRNEIKVGMSITLRGCHSERSEESGPMHCQILRCAQNDSRHQ